LIKYRKSETKSRGTYTMKRMVVGEVEVFSDKGLDNQVVRVVRDGEIIELGKSYYENGEEWIEVYEDLHFTGYINGKATLINMEKYYYVTQDILLCYEKPDIKSEVAIKLKRDEEIYIVEQLEKTGQVWFKVYDKFGISGYIESNSQIHPNEFKPYNAYIGEDLVEVYKIPRARISDLFTKLNRGRKITVMRVVDHGDIKGWMEITVNGKIGYIPRITRLEAVANQVELNLESSLLKDLYSYLGGFKFTIIGIMFIALSIVLFRFSHYLHYLPIPPLVIGISMIIKELLD
jgi:hypothetical protein